MGPGLADWTNSDPLLRLQQAEWREVGGGQGGALEAGGTIAEMEADEEIGRAHV